MADAKKENGAPGTTGKPSRTRASASETALSEDGLAALKDFSGKSTPRERIAALDRLFTAKQMGAVRQRPEFREAVNWLAERAADPSSGEADRLHAFFALATLKADAEILQACEAGPLASLDLIPESKEKAQDQARVLAAIRAVGPSWAKDYALPWTVNEKERTNVRAEAIETVLDATGSVEAGVDAIAQELDRRDRRASVAAFARMALGTLTDLGHVLRKSQRPMGEQPSRSLERLAMVLRGRDLRELTADDQRPILDTFAALVRLVASSRLRFALDASSYAPLLILRGSFASNWFRLADLTENVVAVRKDVADALYVQVRAGVPDGEFKKVLSALHRDEGSLREELSRLAAEPGVSAAMARWLTGATEIAADLQASIDAVTQENERERLADVLIAATAVIDWCESHASAAAVPRAIVQPLVDQSTSFADRRRLVLRGRAGDVTPFDPVRHYPVEVPPEGLSVVRLLTPAIVETRGAEGEVVIRRAIVEAACGGESWG